MLSADQNEKLDEIKTKFQEIAQDFAVRHCFHFCHAFVRRLISRFTHQVGFALGAKDGLIMKIKEQNAPAEENPYQLLDFEVPDWDIKEGDLKKRGYTVTSWKLRRFVALNAGTSRDSLAVCLSLSLCLAPTCRQGLSYRVLRDQERCSGYQEGRHLLRGLPC